jgi:hypothetical protein
MAGINIRVAMGVWTLGKGYPLTYLSIHLSIRPDRRTRAALAASLGTRHMAATRSAGLPRWCWLGAPTLWTSRACYTGQCIDRSVCPSACLPSFCWRRRGSWKAAVSNEFNGIDMFVCLFIYSFMYLFIYIYIYLYIDLLTYLLASRWRAGDRGGRLHGAHQQASGWLLLLLAGRAVPGPAAAGAGNAAAGKLYPSPCGRAHCSESCSGWGRKCCGGQAQSVSRQLTSPSPPGPSPCADACRVPISGFVWVGK